MKRRGTDQMITDSRKPKQGPSPSDALPAVLPDVRMRNSNPANCGMQNCLHIKLLLLRRSHVYSCRGSTPTDHTRLRSTTLRYIRLR